MTDEEDPHTQPRLRIWQQNCRKSLDNTLHLINSLNPEHFDLCLVQEPHIDFLNKTRAPGGWRTILPPSHNRPNTNTNNNNNDNPENPTRAAILVSPRLDTANWMDLTIDSPDLTGIQLWGEFGTIRIINVYADCHHSRAIQKVNLWLTNTDRDMNSDATQPTTPPMHPVYDLILGDFNRHHPMWEDEGNLHLFTMQALDLAQPLLELIAARDLEMVLPKGTPTLQLSMTKTWSRPDNVFISGTLVDAVVHCDTA